MRKDIKERMILIKQDGCDYKTVKKYFEASADDLKPKPPKLL